MSIKPKQPTLFPLGEWKGQPVTVPTTIALARTVEGDRIRWTVTQSAKMATVTTLLYWREFESLAEAQAHATLRAAP
jgi:hypothetical protein